MHIEPGLVEGAKSILGFATGATALLYTARLAMRQFRADGAAALIARTGIATALVLAFFQLLPHPAVGVSEVHLIMGTTLMLLFGTAPAALGLATGLLLQGLWFAPFDLPQFGMNVTTLLVPLFAAAALSRRIIPAGTAYVDLTYAQALRLSLAYQGGIVVWVGFWAVYGGGVQLANLGAIAQFGAAYMAVVLIEPLADLGALALARGARRLRTSGLLTARVFQGA